jgi:predicted RND superfamily exporter protein
MFDTTRGAELSGPLVRLTDSLIRYRTGFLAAAVLVTGLALPIANRLAFDQSIESLYAENDPQLRKYLVSKELFGGDEFVVVAYEDSHLFEEDGISLTADAEQRLRSFAETLGTVPGVLADSTQHLADALRIKFGRKRAHKLVEDFLVGRDNRTTAIILRLADESKTEATRAETIADIRVHADAHNPPAFVVGEPVQIHDMFRLVEQDGGLLFLVSLGVLGTVIFLLFRSLRWVVLPLAVVLISIVWTEAILVLSHTRLSMVSSMLNAMVTVIGIATVTHVTVRYLDARRTMERTPAFRITFVELLPAIFWTCITTAIGFAALLTSKITPVRSFGLMMALASMLVLVVIAVVLPAGFLFGNREAALRIPNPRGGLNRTLTMISGWIERHPRRLMIGGMGALLLAVPGLFMLQVETDFSKNFRESSSIVRGLNFVESRLGGAGSWEVNFPAPSPLTAEFLDRVESLTTRLRDLRDKNGRPALRVASLTDGLSMIPMKKMFSLRFRLRRLAGLQSEFVGSLYNGEEGRMRIMLRGMERQRSETKLALIESAAAMTRQEFGADVGGQESSATGIFVLLAHIIQSLLNDQLVSFGWAALGISVVMTIAFRSLRIGLISLVPNVFPIVIVIGSMGWLGVPVNIGTAMIASVSMGLTVDSTIHYISGYQRARQHYDVIESLKRTNQGVGRALVYAYIALILGFAVLTLSQFVPLVYFGILLSLAMMGGLVGDLLLLPVLLKWADVPQKTIVATTATNQLSFEQIPRADRHHRK